MKPLAKTTGFSKQRHSMEQTNSSSDSDFESPISKKRKIAVITCKSSSRGQQALSLTSLSSLSILQVDSVFDCGTPGISTGLPLT